MTQITNSNSKTSPDTANSPGKSSSSNEGGTSFGELSPDEDEKNENLKNEKSTYPILNELQDVLPVRKNSSRGHKLPLAQAFNAKFVTENERLQEMLGLCKRLSDFEKSIEADKRSL